MNIEEKINELEKQLAELKAELNKEEPEFKNGDKYYYIDSFGNVNYSSWNDDEYDLERFNHGNAFHTSSEAELALKKRKAEIELLKLCDWKEDGARILTLNDETKEWLIDSVVGFTCSPYRFATEASAKAAITQLGDRKLRLIYNIPLED